MENKNNNSNGDFGFTFMAGSDEFSCFHISEFQVGDSIIVNTSDGKVRGLVSGVIAKTATISFRSRGGEGSCNINDICFLSDSERGWLGNV
jgi:hypothetical protein